VVQYGATHWQILCHVSWHLKKMLDPMLMSPSWRRCPSRDVSLQKSASGLPLCKECQL
jgi:hypothetical protein